MIGGTDIVIEHAGPAFIVEVLATIERRWPKMSVEPMLPNHIFVYETVSTRAILDRVGVIAAHQDSFIHILLGPESTTLVVSSRKDSVTHRIANELLVEYPVREETA